MFIFVIVIIFASFLLVASLFTIFNAVVLLLHTALAIPLPKIILDIENFLIKDVLHTNVIAAWFHGSVNVYFAFSIMLISGIFLAFTAIYSLIKMSHRNGLISVTIKIILLFLLVGYILIGEILSIINASIIFILLILFEILLTKKSSLDSYKNKFDRKEFNSEKKRVLDNLAMDSLDDIDSDTF